MTDLSNFKILSVKPKEIYSKLCKRCHLDSHLFGKLECGHFFCRDCIDEMYDGYDGNNTTKNKNILFKCPECFQEIYDFEYLEYLE
jgi:hypothetical protein